MSTIDQHPAALFGPVAVSEYDSSPEYAKPALAAWLARLPGLSDDEFAEVTGRAIFESANCGRFRSNFDHEHCRATAAWAESRRRHVAAGHRKDCHGPTIYSREHARQMRSHGYIPTRDGVCECPGVTR